MKNFFISFGLGELGKKSPIFSQKRVRCLQGGGIVIALSRSKK